MNFDQCFLSMRAVRRISILALACQIALSSVIAPWARVGAQGPDKPSATKLTDSQLGKEASRPLPPGQPSTPAETERKRRLIDAFERSPLRFEVNRGQTDAGVKFISQGHGYTLYLTSSEAIMSLRQPGDRRVAAKYVPLRLRLIGGNKSAFVRGLEPLHTTTNYFMGKDPAGWSVNVPNYARVEYSEVYPGVNQVFYGNQGELEYDFVVAPGGDPRGIRLAFDGAQGLRRDINGDLIVSLPAGELRQRRPVVYQEIDGQRREVPGEYVIERGLEVRFDIGDYDHRFPLTIDPVLAYSTFLGGSRQDEGYGIAVDAAGNAYIAGYTESSDFPITDSMTPGISTFSKALVIKLNATGSGAPEYATLIGGHFNSWAQAIAVDAEGNAYVTGVAKSSSFPTFPINSVAQPNHAGLDDAFVLKLNPEGNRLVYSTFLGGTGAEQGKGIAIDGSGNAYVVGGTASPDFPLSNAMFSNVRTGDAFVTKINPSGSQFIYSTYLGGSGWEEAQAVAVDTGGNAYVTGYTNSSDFPSATWIPSQRGGTEEDAFVAKVNSSGNGLIYATILSGNRDDRGRSIAVDSERRACVTGITTSSDFPLANAIQKRYGGDQDAFVARLSPSGRLLVQSTYLGGSARDAGNGIALDPADNVYVAGLTWSTNFPVAAPIQANNRGKGDAFVAKFNRTLTRLEYSTYLGGGSHKRASTDEALGIAVDSSGTAYLTGRATSADFPTAGAVQAQIRSDWHDLFIAKVYNLSPDSLAIKNISPNHGGDTGWATVNIHGLGFQAGASVKLVRSGQPEIAGQPVRVREAGQLILTTFDLRDKAHGQWDLVVTNPDGRAAVLSHLHDALTDGEHLVELASFHGSRG